MAENIRVVIEGENKDLVAACVGAVAAIKSVDKAAGDANKTQGRYNSTLREGRRDADDMSRAVNALDGAVARTNRNLTFARNIFGALKWPSYAAGASMLAGELANVAAGLTSIVAAGAPAVGVLAAISNGATAALQAIGTVKLASGGVTAAIKAQSAAQTQAGIAAASSAEKQRNAANTVANAHDALAGAQDRSRGAQERLTLARQAARQELEDLKRSLEQTALSERSAELALREAIQRRRELRNDPTATQLGLDEADLAVDQARANLKDVARQHQQQTRQLDDTQRRGIERSKQVVAAQREVATAQREAAGAARQFAEAQHDAGVAGDAQATAATKAQQAMAALSPEAQHFVKTIISLQPELAQLRAAAGEELWPGVEKGILSANRNFGVLKGVIHDTGGELGQIAERWGAFLGSKDFGGDLHTIGEENTKVIDRAGRASVDLAHAFVDVSVAAEPLTDWLSRVGLKAAEGVEHWAATARRTGEAKRFFEETREVLTVLSDILGNTATALLKVGEAGYESGRKLLDELEQVTQHWRDWTSSIQGQNEMAAYFEHARPALEQTGGLIADIGKDWAQLGASQDSAALVKQLRTELLPAVDELLTNLGGGFGPALIDGLTSVVQLFADLSAADGGLTLTLQLLTKVVDGIQWIVDQGGPGMKNALGIGLTGLSLYKLLGIGAAIDGIGKLRKLLASTPTVTAASSTIAADASSLVLGAPPAGLRTTPGGVILPAGVRSVEQPAEKQAEKGLLSKVPGPVKAAGALAVGLGLAASQVNTSDTIGGKGDSFDKTAQAAARLNTQLERLDRLGDSAGAAKIAEQFAHVPSDADKAAKAIAQLADQAQQLADDGGTMGREIAAALDASKAKWDDWAKSGSLSMRGIGVVVGETTADIKHHLGADTAEGKDALAQNFRLAAAEVKKAMDAGTVSTRDGTREITKLFKQALAVYGIKGTQADRYLNGQDTLTGKSDTGNGNAGAGFAGGGWIGSMGEHGPDDVDITVGRGEAVINADQQAVVQGALAAANAIGVSPYGDLDSLFRGEQRPHWMGGFAKGGMVTGDTDYLPAVGRDLERMAEATGIPITVRSGRRSLAEQAALYARYLHGGNLAAKPSPSAPHVRGIAADIAPGREVFGAIAARFGLGFTVPSESWHVQLLDAGSVPAGGATATGTSTGVRKVKWAGPGGALGQIGQGGLNRVRAGANTALGRITGSGVAEPAVSGSGKGGGKAGSEAQARAWIAAGLRAAGQPVTAAAIDTLLGRARQESGLDPTIVNTWDSNAKRGDPSIGFLQTTGSTFRRYAVKGHNDIRNPVDNTAAAVRYMLATYGHLVGASPGGYARGGRVRAARGLAARLRSKPGTGKGKPLPRRPGWGPPKPSLATLTTAMGGIDATGTRANDRDVALGLLIREQDRTQETSTLSGRVGGFSDAQLATVYSPAEIAQLRAAPDQQVEIVNQPDITQHVTELAGRLSIKQEIEGLMREQQRELGALVYVLNQGLAERNKALSGLRDRLKANIARIKALKARIAARKDDLARLRRRHAPAGQIKAASHDIATLTSQVDRLEADNKTISGDIDTKQGEIGDWQGILDKAGPSLHDIGPAVAGVHIDGEEIQDEITQWVRTSADKIDLTQLAPAQNTQRADLLAQQLEAQQRTNALQGQQLTALQGFGSLLAGRFVGAFAHGGPVLQTGMALVHRGENISVDPDGPYANRAGGQRDRVPHLHITLGHDATGLIHAVDARIDGRAAKVTSQDLGRRQRLLTIAPGGRTR